MKLVQKYSWLFAILIAATGCSVIQPTTQVNRLAAIAEPAAINISTAAEVPLVFKMHTATVDICYRRSPFMALEPDLLDPVWLAEQKAIGWGGAAVFGDGSIAQVARIVLPPLKGKGYNGDPKDFATLQEYNEAMTGVLIANWQGDFFTNTVDFVKALGLPMDVTLNKRESWIQNKYRIDQTGAEYIFLWSEVKILPGETWQGYLKWAGQMRDSVNKYYPGKKLIADQPNLFQGDKKSVEWRREINPVTLPGIFAADVYWHSGDQAGYSANQDSNIMRVRNYVDSIIPAQISQFESLFPGWFIVAGQVQPEDRRDQKPIYIINTPTGDLFWGGMYESFVENQAIQPMAIQESMKNCSDPTSATTKILTLLNSTLQPGRNVTQLSFTSMPDCTGYATRYGPANKSHCIVINNWSRVTYTLSNVWVDGKKKVPEFTAIHHTSLDWYSSIILDTIVGETFTVKPGVTVLTYTLK